MPEETTQGSVDEFMDSLGLDEPKNIKDDKDVVDDKQKNADKKDEDRPVFQKTAKKTTKDDSITELRKQRDELKTVVDQFKEAFGSNLDPQTFKPLINAIIDQADGPVTAEWIGEYLENNKKKDETLKEMQKRLEENETKVKELDIRQSSDFNDNYVTPYKNAAQEMFLDFAQVDSDEKVIAPNATRAFNDFLINLKDIDGIKVKAKLQEFIKAFKEESGEEIVIPAVSDIMKSLRTFNASRNKMHEAYTNWNEKKKENEIKINSQREQDLERSGKVNRRVRVEESSKAFQQFDIEAFPFIEESELKEVFEQEFELGEDFSKGKNIPPYSELLTRGAKSRLWDKYAPMIKDLIEIRDSVEKGKRNGVTGSDKFKRMINQSSDEDTESFLTT